MPQRYQCSSKCSQCVSDKYSCRERLILACSGHFEDEGLNMAVCPKHRAELGIFGDLEENAPIRFTEVAKGGPKEGRTHKCAKKLWKSGGYLFQSEQVTKQHVILHALNNFLRHADGRLGPVGSQLSTNVDNVSSSTARYYKRGRENKYGPKGRKLFRIPSRIRAESGCASRIRDFFLRALPAARLSYSTTRIYPSLSATARL